MIICPETSDSNSDNKKPSYNIQRYIDKEYTTVSMRYMHINKLLELADE